MEPKPPEGKLAALKMERIKRQVKRALSLGPTEEELMCTVREQNEFRRQPCPLCGAPRKQ